MKILEALQQFICKLLKKNKPLYVEEKQQLVELNEGDEQRAVVEKFQLRNVIMEKLNYLEQYIKIFSLTFPNEYNNYLNRILEEKRQYNEELSKYTDGISGNITFSVDPEKESTRFVEILKLEEEIKDFVEIDVTYQTYKEKFSLLCLKFNQFYNTLICTKRSVSDVKKQLINANEGIKKLVDEVKDEVFFCKDTRKKEDILSDVVYCDYIIFKANIRCKNYDNIDDYLENASILYSLFDKSYYNTLMFKYFIDDLEELQKFIIANLSDSVSYKHLLQVSQSLQERLANVITKQDAQKFYEEVIEFENTLYTMAKAKSLNFNIDAPGNIKNSSSTTKPLSVNKTAISVFNLMNSLDAKILSKVITSFKYEISWRELYFLCKTFEVYDEVIQISKETIYGIIEKKFSVLDNKYSKFSEDYVETKKKRLLNSELSQGKKYILFLAVGSFDCTKLVYEFDRLKLDYKIIGNDVYLNYSYFHGFKNLELNFGKPQIIN